jgi:glycosyltransferase involved in cell wall biosynthesis
MSPLPISVVIPALNAESFIGEAIASVHAQTMQVAEIIVVDNGCTDCTPQIAAELGARILERKDHAGISPARNKGITGSTEPWIALLDADDLWDPQKIEFQWSAAQAFPQAGVISCYFSVFENDSIVMPGPSEPPWKGYRGIIIKNDRLSYFPWIEAGFFPSTQPSAAMVRREVFSNVGLFDEEILFCEDLDFILRALARYPLAVVERTLVQCRCHPNKHSFHLREMRDGMFAVVNKMLKNPGDYPPGAPEAYRNTLKKLS